MQILKDSIVFEFHILYCMKLKNSRKSLSLLLGPEVDLFYVFSL
jgi:hypothetical protein